MTLSRAGSEGWLTLIGGGEFSFGETLAADRQWVERLAPGPIGFLPTGSGSTDYGVHFKEYIAEAFGREVHTIPIYRSRDARRAKNLDRIAASAAIYIGGGVTDHLIETLAESAALESLAQKLASGGSVIAIAAAAQALGVSARGLVSRQELPGFGWLTRGAVEPNFDPGHDRRLRQLMRAPSVGWGLGLPAGSAVLLGPGGEKIFVGTSFLLEDADGDYQVFQ